VAAAAAVVVVVVVVIISYVYHKDQLYEYLSAIINIKDKKAKLWSKRGKISENSKTQANSCTICLQFLLNFQTSCP
jgi:cell division protein FtsL